MQHFGTCYKNKIKRIKTSQTLYWKIDNSDFFSTFIYLFKFKQATNNNNNKESVNKCIL